MRQGPKGNIPKRHYCNLCIAYESFVTINQLNSQLRVCHPKRVGPLVNKVIYDMNDGSDWSVLFKCVQNDTALNLRRQKARSVEDRRILWTTRKKNRCGLTAGRKTLLRWGLELKKTLGRLTSHPSSSKGLGTLTRHACLSTAAAQFVVAAWIVLYTIIDNSPWFELQRRRVC